MAATAAVRIRKGLYLTDGEKLLYVVTDKGSELLVENVHGGQTEYMKRAELRKWTEVHPD